MFLVRNDCIFSFKLLLHAVLWFWVLWWMFFANTVWNMFFSFSHFINNAFSKVKICWVLFFAHASNIDLNNGNSCIPKIKNNVAGCRTWFLRKAFYTGFAWKNYTLSKSPKSTHFINFFFHICLWLDYNLICNAIHINYVIIVKAFEFTVFSNRSNTLRNFGNPCYILLIPSIFYAV